MQSSKSMIRNIHSMKVMKCNFTQLTILIIWLSLTHRKLLCLLKNNTFLKSCEYTTVWIRRPFPAVLSPPLLLLSLSFSYPELNPEPLC